MPSGVPTTRESWSGFGLFPNSVKSVFENCQPKQINRMITVSSLWILPTVLRACPEDVPMWNVMHLNREE